MTSNLQTQTTHHDASQYIISSKVHTLSDIYNTKTSLVCYCQPASWALSKAAHSYANRHTGEVVKYQGEINTQLIQKIEQTFSNTPHGSLISEHITLMLDIFGSLFEPSNIGIRVLSCQSPHSPAFHENSIIARMSSCLGGTGERWIERQHAHFLPLQKQQLKAQVQPPLTHEINHFCDGDIAIYKGNGWIDHEHNALISASPEFDTRDAKLCIYIDYIN